MKKTLDIKSVCECNRRLGCKTLHPQASIINLEHPDLEQEAVKFEFYAVLLIEECPDGYLIGGIQDAGHIPTSLQGLVSKRKVPEYFGIRCFESKAADSRKFKPGKV